MFCVKQFKENFLLKWIKSSKAYYIVDNIEENLKLSFE